MTWGTERKRHLLGTLFPGCVQHTFPPGVTVVIRDGTPDTKQKDEKIRTVQQFINEKVIKPAQDLLEDTSKCITHYYLLLDRASTAANSGMSAAKKIFAHAKRNIGITPHPDGDDDNKLILPHSGDGQLFKEWQAVIANRDLMRREVHSWFYRGLMEQYTPPIHKTVVIDGAPDHPMPKREYEETKSFAFSNIYFSRTIPGGGIEWNAEKPSGSDAANPGGDVMTAPTITNQQVHRGICPKEVYTHEIAEGDLSAVFHVNKHIVRPGSPPDIAPGVQILVDSGDGDSIMIFLLHARERIDPKTHKFNSRVWVKLRGNQASRDKTARLAAEAKEKGEEPPKDIIDGRDLYVNINKLYTLIDEHPQLSKAQYPQGMVVLLHILGGTDFFDDYIEEPYALFHNVGWDSFVWDTWCAHADRFANMIMLQYSGPTYVNQPDLLRMPFIDEPAMMTFIYQCYASKYGKAIKKLYGVEKITDEILEEYCRSFYENTTRKENEEEKKWQARLKQAKKKRIPPKGILTRYIRLALLNIAYWINDYRPGGNKFVDAFEMYEGFSYYGFTEDPQNPGKIILASVCSLPKPVPVQYSAYVGRHLDHTRDMDEEQRQKMLVKQRREAEKHQAEMKIEAEREARNKKLREKAQLLRKRERSDAVAEESDIIAKAREIASKAHKPK